jgi:hypothetical protein
MATKGLTIEERLNEIEIRLVDAKGKHREKILKRKATLLVLLEKESPKPEIVEEVIVEEPEVVEEVVEEEPEVVEEVVEEEPEVVEEVVVEEIIPPKLLAEELVSVLPVEKPVVKKKPFKITLAMLRNEIL